MMEKINDIAVKTAISAQPSLAHSFKACQPDDLENSMSFQILGLDIMID
jgi:tubulin polyglutamylase TTLL6/13